MTAESHSTKIYPPGPDEPFDINTNEESFAKIPQLLAEYGDVCRVHSKSRNNDIYLVNNPDYIKHILIRNNDNYIKGPGFERVKMLLGNGIIVSDGPFWRRQRRMIQPAFNKKIIAQLSQQIQRCNQELLQRWQEMADQQATINITEEAAQLSLMVILRVLFSDDIDRIIAEQDGNPFAFLTEDLTRDIKVVLKFRALIKLMQDLIDWRRREQPQRFDFLSMFMEARDKDTGEAMTGKELLDELMTFIIAGHETSAITLNWSWYFIANNAKVEQRLLQQIDTAFSGDMPEFDDLSKLGYVQQAVEEALRHYPPVWLFSRTAVGEDRIGDFYIAPGTDIVISPYYLHRHADYWPNAETYDPERFSAEAQKARHKTAYIPFSAGPRRCIGDFFAIVEMQMHFGLMLPRFHLEYLQERPLELEPHINLRTKHPLHFKINHRH